MDNGSAYRTEAAVRAPQLARDAGITAGASCVAGLPGETRQALARAAARVKYLSAIPGARRCADAAVPGAAPA
ncbi:MAG TPA: hypothetical protein PKI19_03190 [Elusimicrobiales bacterium]|nr:hypothetical protein [Elusimicrobiales bacterium]